MRIISDSSPGHATGCHQTGDPQRHGKPHLDPAEAVQGVPDIHHAALVALGQPLDQVGGDLLLLALGHEVGHIVGIAIILNKRE